MTRETDPSRPTDLDFGVLGPLQVTRSGVPQALGGRQQKAVLAMLLVKANDAVSVDRLVDVVWGDRVPNGSVTTIRTYVGHLRDVLEPARGGAAPVVLVTEPAGYRLRLDSAAIDAARFEQQVRTGRSLLEDERFAEASVCLSEALAQWRGPVLADLADYEFVQVAASRLDELRLVATEARIEADLALGRHRDLVGELDRLATENPLREGLHGQRMLALYRCGQQAAALTAYRRLRESLAEELGIDPSASLQELHRAILRQDSALDQAPLSQPEAVPTKPVVAAADSRTEHDLARRRPERRLRWAIGSVAVIAVTVTGGCIALLNQPQSTSLSAFPANSVGRIGADGRLVAEIAVGQSPSGLAYGAGSLWSTNSGDDSVSRIDPHDGRVVQTIGVGKAPSAVTVAGEVAWVANGGSGTVSRISTLNSRVVATVSVGNLPAAIGSGPSGVWVANGGDDTVQRIDPTSGRPDPPIPVGGNPAGVAVGADTVWVTNSSDGTVSRLRVATGQAESPIPVGSGPRGIAIAGDAVWVGNGQEQTVNRIDLHSGRVVATIPVGDGPQSVVAGAGDVWASGEFDGSVTRIDPVNNGAGARVATGGSPRGLALVGSAVWVASGSLAGSGHRGGTLTVSGDIPFGGTIDAAQSWDLGASHLVYDGLVALRRVGGSAGESIVPDLAETLPRPTDGGRTYTFTVRRGVRYSNGVEVRPDDLRRGLQRTLILRRGIPDYYSSIIGASACAASPRTCDLSRGVEIDDATSTIAFHLTAPDPDFLHKLTVFVWATAPSVPMRPVTRAIPTTGPYMISEYKADARLTMVRNPYFDRWSFAARPDGYPDVIRWINQPDATTRTTDVVNGRADVAPLIWGLEDGSDLAVRYPTRLHTAFELGSYAEWLNTREPPFNDWRVRRALNYAVDRRKVVTLWGGDTRARVTCQMLPPSFPGYKPYCPYTTQPDRDGTYHGPDVDRARQLIHASGTVGMTVRVWAQPIPAHRLVGQYYARLLRGLGYRVPPLVVTDGMYSEGADSRNHVQIGDTWWGADFPAPSNFWQPQLSCASLIPSSKNNPNLSQYCNPRVDELGRRAQQTELVDPAAARRLWAELDRTITDDAPMVFGPASLNSSFVSARVGNYMSNPTMGPLLDQMWVQ